MIFGKDKYRVVENIKMCAEAGRFNDKVEVEDPELTPAQRAKILKKFMSDRKTFGYWVCNHCARLIAWAGGLMVNKDTEFIGIEKIKGIKGGAVITSNHFSPVDNTAVRQTVHKAWHQRLFIVSQETNLAMTGFIGFMMNYSDIIPIVNNGKYMSECFGPEINDRLKLGQKILIYPEQEMWLNYRKPRPPKRGAYFYAASNNVPIVSLFVEIKDADGLDTEEFRNTQYIMHVLDPIYPDPEKSVRENSIEMMNKDYEQKKQAYEEAYDKELTYEFDYSDVAGWIVK